jgi:Family of unknown function (DUF5372)
LRGQSFEALAVLNNWGGDRVSYAGPEGRVRSMPVEWTDVVAPDLVVTLGAGQVLFRADRLRLLRALLDAPSGRKVVSEC